jgi:hypothetical protein
MEDGDFLTDRDVTNDMRDLFAYCSDIGKFVEVYDVASDRVESEFQCVPPNDYSKGPKKFQDRMLKEIRGLLKKYHRHEALPARRGLAKWRVLREKFLPILRQRHTDR